MDMSKADFYVTARRIGNTQVHVQGEGSERDGYILK